MRGTISLERGIRGGCLSSKRGRQFRDTFCVPFTNTDHPSGMCLILMLMRPWIIHKSQNEDEVPSSLTQST
jgi:hypothetical protein